MRMYPLAHVPGPMIVRQFTCELMSPSPGRCMEKHNYSSTNRRLFIIHATSLLARGMQIILKEHGLEAMEIDVREGNVTHCIDSLEAGDIVIMDRSDAVVRCHFGSLQALVQSADLTLVCISSEENAIEIYRKEKRTVGGLRDLFEVIWRA